MTGTTTLPHREDDRGAARHRYRGDERHAEEGHGRRLEILDEMFRNLGKNRPDIPEERLSRLRGLMNAAVADCLVTDYEPIIEILELPDPDGRHVLAAAIRSSAQVIVTRNTKDFPAEKLRPWNIEAKIPDDFVLDQIHIDARIVYACVQEIASSRTNPPGTVEDVLGELERAGLVQSVAALRLG